MEESKRLQSGELRGQISCDQWFFRFPFCRSWGILAVWAREAFTHLQEFDTLPGYFVTKEGLFLHYITPEIRSFQMSLANNFCDWPLPRYLDLKTVLIYCPHPVLYILQFYYHL
jgi:hypothetical protein